MRFPVYSWFLPLQDALDLPQGFVYTFYSPRDALEPEWTDEVFPDELRKARSAVSVKVWQIEDTYDRIGARVDHAMRACKRAFPMYFSDDAADSEQSDADTEDHEQQLTDPPLVPVTVLEANYAEFRLLPTGFDDDGDLPGHVLESVIEKVQLIQRACSYTNGRPTRQLTIQNLPMHIRSPRLHRQRTGLTQMVRCRCISSLRTYPPMSPIEQTSQPRTSSVSRDS